MTHQPRLTAGVAALLGLFALGLSACGPHLGDRLTGPLGCGGLLVLILAFYAIVSTLNSTADTATKVLWCLIVFFLPLLGFLLWLFFGPKKA